MWTLMRGIDFVVLMALAALPLWRMLSPECFLQHWNKENVQGAIHFYLVPVAALLIGLNLIAILLRLASKYSKRQDIEIYSNDEPTTISASAVEKRLLDLAAKFPGVRQTKIALDIHGRDKPIICKLSFGLACETDITGRIDEIKKCLRDAYNRLLPGTAGIEIITVVSELRAEDKLPETPKKDAAEFDENSFAGPVYSPASEHFES
jgi:hypothetical protein